MKKIIWKLYNLKGLNCKVAQLLVCRQFRIRQTSCILNFFLQICTCFCTYYQRRNFRLPLKYEQYKEKYMLGALAGHIAAEQQVVLESDTKNRLCSFHLTGLLSIIRTTVVLARVKKHFQEFLRIADICHKCGIS